MFALVDATMLRPLPYADGDELVHFWTTRATDDSMVNFSHPTFVDLGEQSQTLEGVAAYHSPSMTLTEGDASRTVESVRVSPNFFSVLGVEPAMGRNFRSGDDELSADRIIIVSDGFWRTQYGADPDILGRTLTLDSRPYTVVGVLPQDFVFARERVAEVWRPLIPTEREAEMRGFRWMHIIGRMADGANIVQAQGEMDRLAADMEREYPEANTDRGIHLRGMREQVIGDTGTAVTAVYAAVLLVLLITCANLAHLLLARGAERRGEIAVRKAMGATHWQLVRLVLVEVLMLFAAGGVLGALFAGWLLDAVVALMPGDAMQQAPFLGELSISAGVVAYGFALALACGGVFGLIPAFQVGGSGQVTAEMGSRGALPRLGSRVLVGSQVAIAVALMGSTLLLVRSTLELANVDPGFDTENLLTLRISLPGARYEGEGAIEAFNRDLVERVAALPGVVGVAAVDRLPLTGNSAATRISLPGADEDAETVRTNVHVVSPEYFDVMRMPLLTGRGLATTDTAESTPVTVINDRLAGALFGDLDPLGRQIVTGGGRTLEIVGVVGAVRINSIEDDPVPAMFFHVPQLPGYSTGLAVRTHDDPTALIGAVRAEVVAIDSGLDIYEVAAMSDLIAGSPTMLTRTIPAMMLSGFAGFATLLVALGLFAVVGHDVAARTREIGVRRALGALPGSVVRDITAGTMSVVVVGVVAGVVLAVGAGRLLQSVLFGVGTADPAALMTTAAAVLVVSLLACLLPARRALNVEPTEALRAE